MKRLRRRYGRASISKAVAKAEVAQMGAAAGRAHADFWLSSEERGIDDLEWALSASLRDVIDNSARAAANEKLGFVHHKQQEALHKAFVAAYVGAFEREIRAELLRREAAK
jgi:hypothetical protein